MIKKSSQIFGAIALVCATLSLFSVWNILQWDFLNWGTQLFLFPFLCAISVMGFFSKADPSWSKISIFSLILVQVVLYFIVFKFQDPYSPQLLLLLIPSLLAIQLLLAGKFWRRKNGSGILANKWFITFCLLSAFAIGLETKAALYSELQLLYFGMSIQTIGILWFFALRVLSPK